MATRTRPTRTHNVKNHCRRATGTTNMVVAAASSVFSTKLNNTKLVGTFCIQRSAQ